MYPPNYIQSLQTGTSAAGVFVSFLRIVTKLSFSNDSTGLKKSIIVYFTLSALFMILCVLVYFLMEVRKKKIFYFIFFLI